MTVIKHTSQSIGKTVKVSTIVGKKVLTKDGEKVGSLRNIHIDPKGLRIEGIYVGGGIFRQDSYIGRGYIDSMTQDGVILSIVPVERYVGLAVLDSRGRNIGKVKKITKSKNTNTLISFVLYRGPFGGKDIIIAASQIKEAGKKVVLNTTL